MVSIIVPTYNGAHKLSGILESLDAQSVKDFEVIIAVDGSTDHTIEVLERVQPNNYTLNFFYQQNRGRAAIRNFGAKKAAGDLLIFFDDDMRPVPCCVERHIKHFKDFPGSLATGKQIEEEQAMQSDVQKFKRYLSLKWYKPLESTFRQARESLSFTAANCSLPASIFWELNGFDEQLSDAEDYDLAQRAAALGKNVFYLNDAIGYHDDFISARSFLKRLRQYREAHQKLTEIGRGNIHKEGKTAPFKLFIYKIFSHSCWVNLIEQEQLSFLPRRLRYKLYDVIFTSLSRHFPGVRI
ncbi:glycosyltransferase family 2 protein [Nafulsella turpanensis]|uniref:glycosyltransferase family 2 protein n=1 Tax=Nafulsella turpanensis TaxID=1265690 RepID=UPI000349C381|nr:glycosyltransferase family 2 protein [Nafulsella turpanensis]